MSKSQAASHYLATDELASYEKVGKEFSGHGTVNHSADEYVRLGGFIHVNTAECRFSLMKRAVFGTHHSISEAHLPRYLAEWDFKWNTRKITDGERAAIALKGTEGKRLTYRQPNEAAHALAAGAQNVHKSVDDLVADSDGPLVAPAPGRRNKGRDQRPFFVASHPLG